MSSKIPGGRNKNKTRTKTRQKQKQKQNIKSFFYAVEKKLFHDIEPPANM
jgi:hypothetical protein